MSVGLKLLAMGFPRDTEAIKTVYLNYCRSNGVTEEEAELDLRVLETHINYKKLAQAQAMKKTRREAVERAYHGRTTGCDPELCSIL